MNAILRDAISYSRNRISTALFTVSAVFYFAGATGLAAEFGFTNALTAVERLDTAHLRAVHNARETFTRQRHATPEHGLYEDLPSILHVHAEDAEHTKGTRAQLLAAAKMAGIKVVMMTEHRGPKPDAWRGMHEGVLFIAGSETGAGTLWYPEFDADGKAIPDSGLKFLSHIEERYDAATEGMVGMEICNRHTDAILDKSMESFLATTAGDSNRWNSLVSNFREYPDEIFAAGTAYHPEIFAKWDKETKTKHFTGIAANDAHQNVMIKGITFDPYEVSFRDMVTHILARGQTEALVREALTDGHVYVSHDWLCGPTGFSFGAINNLGVFGIGDEAPLVGKTRIMAITPIPAHLRIILNGEVVQEASGTNITFDSRVPGPCRVEAWLNVDGEDRPWIFSNPIYLRAAKANELRLPSMELSAEVEAHKDISYLEGPEPEASKHKLDVYAPKGKTALPVLFFIHGGAWKSGDRSFYPPLGNRYARAGVLTVIPSYRLAPKYPHPAQIEDVAAAFAWTVQHAAEYGGDTNRIFVAGHSAGGHLVALLALDPSRLARYKLTPQVIRGVMAWSGVYNLTVTEGLESVFGDDMEVRREASPMHHVKAGAPRFMVSYCQYDYFSLPGQARQFQRALRRAGVDAELLYIPDENHLSEMIQVTKPEDPLVAAALKFMK